MKHLGAIDNNNLVDMVTAWQVTVHKISMSSKLLENGVKVEICTWSSRTEQTHEAWKGNTLFSTVSLKKKVPLAKHVNWRSRKTPQEAPECISEHLNLKILWGGMPPELLTRWALQAQVTLKL